MSDVEKLLTDKKVFFHSKGKDVLVHCFNPEHEDSSPSMRIDRESGMFHCLSCGYKGNVFTYFNKHRNIFNRKVQNLYNKITEIRNSTIGLDMPDDAILYDRLFRGIPAEVLNRFRAFTTSEMGMENRIVFPIVDAMENIVGFQGRYINSTATPKYMMYPKEVSLPWYPSPKYIKPINGSIVVVEGLLDAVYLHSKGITNAVCAFGTKSAKMENIEELLTPYMLIGVQTVYLMMDGDDAGRAASANFKKFIERRTDLVVEEFDLPDGEDPASLSDQFIENVKKYLHNN